MKHYSLSLIILCLNLIIFCPTFINTSEISSGYVNITRGNGELSWEKYNRLQEIYDWMDYLQSKYSFVKVLTLGKSYEGRDIKMLRISKGGCSRGKPKIFIEAGIHAREWISPSTSTVMINELIQVSGKDKQILTDIVWYFVPVFNVDGYEYSHTTDRHWRKSRSKFNGDKCIGTDLNRNFNFHWGRVGISHDPCSSIYPGPFPASDPETQALQNFVYRNRRGIKLYLAMHSYQQHFCPPWGYKKALPGDYGELSKVAEEAMSALTRMRGTKYIIGSSAEINVVSSGGTRDWAKGVAKIKYSFLIELPPDSSAKGGFDLPPKEIIPTGKETWEAVKVLARHIVKKYPKRTKSKPRTEL